MRRFRSSIRVPVVGGILLAVLASGWSASGATIQRVTVQRETGPASEGIRQLVLDNIKSVRGTTFSEATRSDDIRRLYRTGRFDAVTVDFVDEGELVVRVRLKVTVRKIRIVGNKKFKEKRVRALISHAANTPLDENQLAADAAEIRRKYLQSGYHGATVKWERQDVEDSALADVVFRIDEGARAKLKRVLFQGNQAFETRELRKAILTRRPWWNYIFPWGNYFNERQLEFDKDRLRELYTTKGYLDLKVTGVETRFNDARSWVTVVFVLAEGTPYTVGKVTLDRNERFSDSELLPLIVTAPGRTYSSTVEKEDIRRIRAKYEPLGYLDFTCYEVHDVNTDEHTVDVTFRFREGSVSHIRNVDIVGNRTTKDHVIRRELALHPGDLGDAGKVRVSTKRLRNLNYFSTVSISPVSTGLEGLKDLRVKVEEKSTGRFMIGGGFSSEDSLVGNIEVVESNFDWREWPLPRGGGQRLRLRLQTGTERQDFVLSFVEPWWLDRRLRLELDAYSRTRYEDEYEQLNTGVRMIVTKAWKPFWRRSMGIQLENVEVSDFEGIASAELLREEGTYTANRLIFGLARDTRDSSFDPTRGSQLGIDLRIVTQALGSYSNYGRLSIDGRTFLPVFEKSTLVLRGTLAAAEKISGDDIAIFDRYFAGGQSSIRGFDRRDVGPVDINEDPLGGEALLLLGAELVRPFSSWLRGSVFMDTGNVWERIQDVNPAELSVGVGIGLLVKLPVGATGIPLRLDYGWPIFTDWEHLKDEKGRTHFRLGYFF